MDALGYITALIVAAALAAGGQYLIERTITFTRNLVYLFVLSLIGVYAGSEMFGELATTGGTIDITSLSQIGPEIGGFYMLTGIIGGLVMVVAGTFALRRAATGKPTDVAAEGIRDPQVAHFLFNDIRSAPLWLGIRLFIGFEWLAAGLHKVTDEKWMGSGVALKGFWERAVAVPANGGKPLITYGWYRDFLQYLLDNNAYTWFAKLVAMGEVLIGLGLIVGCLVGFAAFFGALMNFNFMLAGTASTNPVLFALAILLILAWKVAGYYGVDRYLLPVLGAPWSPGRAFRHEPQVGAQPA